MPPIPIPPSTSPYADSELERSDEKLALFASVNAKQCVKDVDDVQQGIEHSDRSSRDNQVENDSYELVPGSLKRRVQAAEEESPIKEPHLLKVDANGLAIFQGTPWYERRPPQALRARRAIPAKAVAPSPATLTQWDLAQRRLIAAAKRHKVSISPGGLDKKEHIQTEITQCRDFSGNPTTLAYSSSSLQPRSSTLSGNDRSQYVRKQNNTSNSLILQPPIHMPNRDPKQSASDALYVNDRTSTGRSGKPMTHQEPSKPGIVRNTLLMRSQMSSLPCSTKGIALSRDTAEPGNNMTRQKWPVANAERLTTMAAARDPSLRDLNELPTKIHQMARPNDQSGTSPNNSSLQPSTSISTGDISQIPPQTLPTESTNPLPEPLPTKESSNSGRGYRAAPNRRRYPPLRPC